MVRLALVDSPRRHNISEMVDGSGIVIRDVTAIMIGAGATVAMIAYTGVATTTAVTVTQAITMAVTAMAVMTMAVMETTATIMNSIAVISRG